MVRQQVSRCQSSARLGSGVWGSVTGWKGNVVVMMLSSDLAEKISAPLVLERFQWPVGVLLFFGFVVLPLDCWPLICWQFCW